MNINVAKQEAKPASFIQKKNICISSLPAPDRINLSLHLPGSPNKGEVESFIHEQYKIKHDAIIKHYMPYLLSLEQARNILSAVGLRPACNEKLFLEQYLDNSIDDYLSKRIDITVKRSSVIEAGNLASSCPGSSRLMIMAITFLLYHQGFEWVVMTGTNEVVNIFRKLKLEPVILVKADQERLIEESNNWGNYYTHDPKVLAGNIKTGHNQLLKLSQYSNFISSLQAFHLPACP